MELNSETIESLIREAVYGDQRAMKKLFDAYATHMYNLCIRMTSNSQDAEDIVQESFIQAFKKLSELKNPSTFGGWLRQIIINNCLKYIKKRVSFEDLADNYEEYRGDDEGWEELNFEAMHHAIKALPEGCRQIFLLYVIEDYSHKEVASLLGISESTSKSQYLRAKKLLKKQLQWTI